MASSTNTAGGTSQLSVALIRKLKCIKYADPEAVLLTAGNPRVFCELVVWLEDTKIRLWKQKKRDALKKFSDGPQWVATLIKYLDALGLKGSAPDFMAKINSDTKFQHALLDRLVSFAIEDVYLDRADRLDTTMEAPVSKSNTSECSFQAMIEPINKCLAMLNVPELPPNAPKHQVLAALKCILVRLDENAGRDKEEQPLNHIDAMARLKKYASGVNVPGQSEDLQMLIKILRLINVHDLRETQEVINKSIAKLQDITGDPRTDTNLYVSGKG